MQHTDITQYNIVVFELRWDAPGLVLSRLGVSRILISNNGL
uniref:Uncharacterized protein n=1 Tax=Arundo donax TaxID=35708 RepID=A0A0A9D9P0_ARUDO